MKLPKPEACQSASGRGKSEPKYAWRASGSHKGLTVMGETAMEGLSDAGSTPASSIEKK